MLKNKHGTFLTLLILMLFLMAGGAMAALLGSSDFYDGYTDYSETYDGKLLTGRLEFAVYDTQTSPANFENVFPGLSAPGDGRYIYAYQIFHDQASEDDLSYFGLIGVNELNVSGATLHSLDDGSNGVEPEDPAYFTGAEGDDRGVWEFNPAAAGYIMAALDDHSWLMCFSSNFGPTEGAFEIRGTDGETAPPVPEAPEPATIALLGLGGSTLLRKRERKA